MPRPVRKCNLPKIRIYKNHRICQFYSGHGHKYARLGYGYCILIFFSYLATTPVPSTKPTLKDYMNAGQGYPGQQLGGMSHVKVPITLGAQPNPYYPSQNSSVNPNAPQVPFSSASGYSMAPQSYNPTRMGQPPGQPGQPYQVPTSQQSYGQYPGVPYRPSQPTYPAQQVFSTLFYIRSRCFFGHIKNKIPGSYC